MPAPTLESIGPPIGQQNTTFPMIVRASPIDNNSIVIITVGGRPVTPTRMDSGESADRMQVQIDGAVTYLLGAHPVLVQNSDGSQSNAIDLIIVP